MKKNYYLVILVILVTTFCGAKDDKKVITWVTYSGTGEEYLQEINPIIQKYAEINSNVTVKLEILPSTDYDKIMRIRATSKKLPDILVTRVKTMNAYEEYLLPLNDLTANKNNSYAEKYAVNGKILGIPLYGFHEFVYYNKDLFQELNLQVPTTWTEFTNIIKTIQDNSDYIPFALGGKDSWALYPFVEFIPMTIEGGDQMFSSMAYTDTPFSRGNPIYSAYEKVSSFFEMKPFGKDPFGYGFTQSTDLVLAKKAVMMAAGQWHYQQGLIAKTTPENVSNIGIFYLPVRDKKTDPFRYIVTGEVFLGVPKNGENNKEALEFIEWLFASDYYQEYIVYNYYNATTKEEGTKQIQTIFTEALAQVEDPQPVLQLPEELLFEDIKNYTKFHTRTMGQALLSGTNLDMLMDSWNTKWTEARKAVTP